MAFSGIGKLIKDLVTGTPADTDYFAFGNTDLKKISFPNLKKALGIDALNSALRNKLIIGSDKNTMLVVTSQTLNFSNGTATFDAGQIAAQYSKTVLNAIVQLKSAGSATITSANVSGNKVTVRCGNLSGTAFTGSIAVSILLCMGT